MATWSTSIATIDCHHRAGGRRRINSVRHLQRQLRIVEALRLSNELMGQGRGCLGDWGIQQQIADRMGLSRSTVSKYLKSCHSASYRLNSALSLYPLRTLFVPRQNQKIHFQYLKGPEKGI